MTKIIELVDATFDANNIAILNVPNHAEVKAFKFYENAPDDVGQRVGVVVLVDDPPIVTGTHPRVFVMVPDGGVLPPNFKDYKATFPFGPDKVLMHCIEVVPEPETGDFNPETAVIT